MAQKKREKRIVGWKEHVALPDLKVKSVIAKIDTGASVASIDASEIKIVKRQGVHDWVRFEPATDKGWREGPGPAPGRGDRKDPAYERD